MKKKQAGIIAACINGEKAAIEQLIAEYQLDVLRLALSVLNNTEEANEAAQDTFIAALKALKFYKEKSSFKAWLLTIALNISRSRLRKRKAQERLQQTLISTFQIKSQSSPNLEEMVIHNEEDEILWKAINDLSEKQRIPIVLRYYHDLSIAEIAEIMNIKKGTVHSRLSIGRERLRSMLTERGQAIGDN